MELRLTQRKLAGTPVAEMFGDWGYVEPILFGHAAAKVVELWWRDVVRGEPRLALVQCHEWMTGSALLYLKPRIPEMGTIFTEHATVIGRAAAATGVAPQDAVRDTTPEKVADALGVRARHSMEGVSAREARRRGCIPTATVRCGSRSSRSGASS